jgi:hypothetical protein
MSVSGGARGRDSGDADKVLSLMLAALIVLLLFAANVQLWRQGSGDEAEGRTAATAQSTLPPPVSGTSNNVLSKRLGRFSNELTIQMNGLRSQLTGFESVGAAQRAVALQIKGMSASIRRFGGVRREIGQMTDGMGRMVSNTREMSNGLNATRMSMTGMVKVMKRVEGGIAATNASSREASAGIAAMRDATSVMAESFAGTAANGREMTMALTTMNERMNALVEIFCAAFNSSMPACALGEAPSAATAAPEPAEPEALRQGLSPALRLGPEGGG